MRVSRRLTSGAESAVPRSPVRTATHCSPRHDIQEQLSEAMRALALIAAPRNRPIRTVACKRRRNAVYKQLSCLARLHPWMVTSKHALLADYMHGSTATTEFLTD